MWDEAGKIYPLLKATPNQSTLQWRFPSGARITFAHMQFEKDKYQYDGAQIPLIGFDQLEHFEESQFWYMLSRNRSQCGVIPYVRATCNPDAESWLARLLAWWIDPDTGYAILERSGVIRWFARVGEKLIWADNPEDLSPGPDRRPKSLTFVPASPHDNKIGLANDPGYLANLMALPPVERERLLSGNWKIKPAAGLIFNRDWFEIMDPRNVPPGGEEVRFWDFAASKRTLKKKDPDSTAGVKIRQVYGVYYVTHSLAVQEGPAEVDRLFLEVSRQDADQARGEGINYRVRWEIEPGSASLRENLRLVQFLAGFDARGIAPQGDKITRAKPLASQAQAGNVKLMRGAWNEEWLTHMHHQPEWPHDDIMDASSGAFNDLAESVGMMEITLPPRQSITSQAPGGVFLPDYTDKPEERNFKGW